MALKIIVQSWYNREISTLSEQAWKIVSYFFSDYTELLSIYNRGQSALNAFSTLFPVKKEIWELAERLHNYFVKEKLYELQKNAMRDICDKRETEQHDILDEYLKDIYRFLLNEESPFVMNTIRINCPDYQDALPFVDNKKSTQDFLRCTERQRKQLQDFFLKFGDIYNKLKTNCRLVSKDDINDVPKEISSSNSWTQQLEQSMARQVQEKPKANIKNKSKANKKSKPKSNKKNEAKGVLDTIHEEEKANKNKKEERETQYIGPIYNIDDLYRQSFSYSQIQSPSFYDVPSFIIDDFHMMISINNGCNGTTLLGLQSNYVEQPIGYILYNFERFHAKYNPDEEYKKPVVSDKITRYSHGYRWFGVKGFNYLDSLDIFGITALCTNLYFGEYKCYVPVWVDDDEEDYVVMINTSDDVLVSLLTRRKELLEFLTYNSIDLREFKLFEITDKLEYLSRYFDLYEFLGLDNEELEPKKDVALRLQAIMAKKSIDQFVWDSYSIEEKNDFLRQKTKAYNNKGAFLWFNIVKTRYIPYSKEIEISYLIRSEYSIEVYVDIDIEYKDGTTELYSDIEVQPYDDKFEFFQGRTRVSCTQDCMNIALIELNCSDH